MRCPPLTSSFTSYSVVKHPRPSEEGLPITGVEPGAGVEPASAVSETAVFPLDDPGDMVGGMGIEPTSIGLRIRCVALTPTSHSWARRGLNPRFIA